MWSLLILLTLFAECCWGRIDSLVQVYDNVVGEEARLVLYHEGLKWQNENIVFEFPLEQPQQHWILEQILNDILLQLYHQDDAIPHYYVEYWTRKGWWHILPHADMDEVSRKELESRPDGDLSSSFSHPETGHVLYIQLGSKVKGPTCVFNVSMGGELLKQETTELIVVPAVQGRLLRFQGHLLHAVPRPADIWMSPTHENEQGPDYERMVLLFNLWPTDRLDRKGRTIVESNETFTSGTPPHSCNSVMNWKSVDIWNQSEVGEPSHLQFPLMGDEHRRGTPELSIKMQTAESSRKAFLQDIQPTRVWLHPRKEKKKKSLWSFMGLEF